MNELDKRQIRRAFCKRHGGASPRGGATQTHAAAERLWERVGDMAQTPALVADIGGDGAFVAARYPQARVVAADFAPPVLRGAPKTVWKTAADAEALPFGAAVADLVWSNLCAEWTALPVFLSEAARILKNGGLLAMTTVGPDTLRELRALFAGEERVHRFADMHDVGDALLAGGFAEPIMESDLITLTYSTAAAAIADMRDMGGGCALATRPRGWLGRNRYRRACVEYANNFTNADGRIFATVELVTATAWRRESQPAAEAPLRFYRGGAGG